MTEKRKKEVLMNALRHHLRDCEKLARRYPEFPEFKREAVDVKEIIREISEEWKD